jgi:predicted Zn-dependent protease
MLFTEAEARALCERMLGASSAEAAEVRLRGARSGNARFAANQITTSADVEAAEAAVTARVGRRSASVTFNDLTDAGISAAVSRAERLAQLAPADPELMPLLGPQAYEPSSAFFEATAALTAEQRAEAVATVVEAAAQAAVTASGFLEHRAQAHAVANSAGLFAFHRSTEASFTITVRTTDGAASGWAGGTHNDWSRVPAPAGLAAQAIEKARAGANAVAVEPGAYTVVLEPTAAGNLLRLLFADLDARAADEGRSFFSRRGGGTKVGERIADQRVTLLSDPRDPDLLEPPFTEDGLPVGRTVWVEGGVLRALAVSRFWAAQQRRDPVPLAGGVKLAGGAGTAADLASRVERGLLVTRFWYIRSVDRRTLSYTGLTRDGLFLIENGRITRPVRNLRFNESPVTMLNHLVALGTPVRVVASESGGLGPAVVAPPMVVREFRFTAGSEAV